MTADPLLLLAWLIVAHLAADFVLQTDGIARGKTARGRRGTTALLTHGSIVAVCLVPAGLAFGPPGWIFLAVSALSHVAIDRVKIDLTRRVPDGASQDQVEAGLGPAWSFVPAALFALDQFAHLAVLVVGWVVLLARAPLQDGWSGTAADLLQGWDLAVVHDTALTGVVLLALVIINVRAGALFVAVLVGSRLGASPDSAAGTPTTPGASTHAGRASAWVVRLGPLRGRVDAESPPAAVDDVAPPGHGPPASPARVGEAIGILERLLIVSFVLSRAEAAIGLVIAAKTLARFRQLDDRDFAEYYLLGTLASVAIAVVSGFVAAAVLDTVR